LIIYAVADRYGVIGESTWSMRRASARVTFYTQLRRRAARWAIVDRHLCFKILKWLLIVAHDRIPLRGNVALFQIGPNCGCPGSMPTRHSRWRQALESVVIQMDRQANLLHVIQALTAPGRLASRLDCWEQQRH